MAYQPSVVPFDLSDVQLLDPAICARQDRNIHYLLSLDLDRLLHNFRVNAGIATSAEPLGGWEAPTCGLRGHFVGHYLSACAIVFHTTHQSAFKDRLDYLVAALDVCQQKLGHGYLSACPESDLDAIETKFEGAWASYYTLHKILAGLIDAYRFASHERALVMAGRLAAYVKQRLEKIEPERLDKMLHTDKPNPTNEFGGWSQAMQDLYAITHHPEHLKLAEIFDRDWFLKPLANQRDELTGLHSNTHIAMVLGAAARYERTGDPAFRQIATYFWDRTAVARSFANGGSSGPRPDGSEKSVGGEHWFEPFKLAHTLTPKNNESCVTHNMLRLTERLFCWSTDERYTEFYERAYFNHVLAMQHTGYLGGYIYSHPLCSHSHKDFGHADDTFWCCYGSSIEAFAGLQQGIYYHSDDALWVNMPISSRVYWHQKQLTLTQQTDCAGSVLTSRLIVECDYPADATLAIRIPRWSQGVKIAINNQPQAIQNDRGYGLLARLWQNGDTVTITYHPTLRFEAMPDDPNLVAFMFGPFVLAACTDADFVMSAPDANTALAAIEPVAGSSLAFQLTLQTGPVKLVPLNQIVDEIYAVYCRIQIVSV